MGDRWSAAGTDVEIRLTDNLAGITTFAATGAFASSTSPVLNQVIRLELIPQPPLHK